MNTLMSLALRQQVHGAIGNPSHLLVAVQRLREPVRRWRFDVWNGCLWPARAGGSPGGGARAEQWRELHREINALSRQVHLRHGDHDFLLHFDHLRWIFDETVAELADVDQPVLVDADVPEGTKSRHIGDDASQFHPRFQVLHLLAARLEGEPFKLLARITARLAQFGQDVGERRQANLGGDIFRELDFLSPSRVPHQVIDRTAYVPGHLVHDGITLGMYRAAIQRVCSIADAQKPRRLLERFRAQTRYLL